MVKAWRAERCLLQSSSLSSGNSLFQDFHFFKYLWECQNFFAFFVRNILQSYSEHIMLQPGCIRLSLSLSSSLRVAYHFSRPYWAGAPGRPLLGQLYLCGCQRSLFTHHFKLSQSSAAAAASDRAAVTHTGWSLQCSCHLQSHPTASLETISATGFALYFPLLLNFKVPYCAFPYFASFIVFNLLGPFLIIIIPWTFHDKAQSVFWSGYYTQ